MPEFLNKRNYLILLGLIFISIVILTIHAREGENGLIHRASRFAMAATSPLQRVVTVVIAPVKDGWDYLIHFGDLKRENKALNREVIRLKDELGQLHGLKKENTRLQKLLEFKNKKQYGTVLAYVIGKPVSNWWSSVIVDGGLADGVQVGMPVVAGGGLVGQVADTSKNYAKVIFLNDTRSGVSVQIKRTGEVGVIKGQLKNERLVLKYISRESTIKRGDVVETSGLGGVFPKGIYVGRVVEVKQSDYSLYKYVEVNSPANFATLEEVLVVKEKPKTSFFREDS